MVRVGRKGTQCRKEGLAKRSDVRATRAVSEYMGEWARKEKRAA